MQELYIDKEYVKDIGPRKEFAIILEGTKTFKLDLILLKFGGTNNLLGKVISVKHLRSSAVSHLSETVVTLRLE